MSSEYYLESKYLPGQPLIKLSDTQAVVDFLQQDLIPESLNKISSHLWWMSKQDSSNISALHRQAVKGRAIIVTEEPRLHLVWAYDRIFIKPLPAYLLTGPLSCGLDDAHRRPHPWGEALASLYPEILGFLRTYACLIKHESDYRVACEAHLIPDGISWLELVRFLAPFSAISDQDCSPRYWYGEIRLTRLNFYSRILLHRSHYHRIQYHYSDYFARFYAPVLFFIGLASVTLSSLQVISQLEPDLERGIRLLSLAVSVVLLLIAVVSGVLFFLVLTYKLAKEWRYAIRDRLKHRAEQNKQASSPL